MEIDVTPIIVALITSLGGILGAFMAVRKGNREREINDAIREQKQSDKLNSIDEKIIRLEKKVDIHNGYAEKFGAISQTLIALSKDVEYLRKRGK